MADGGEVRAFFEGAQGDVAKTVEDAGTSIGRLVHTTAQNVHDSVDAVEGADGTNANVIKARLPGRDDPAGDDTGTGEAGSRTEPSGQADPDAVPGGRPATIYPKDNPETERSLRRENESAITLARNGYNIEQRPSVPGPKEPDYLIEGRIFDNYAPRTGNARNIAFEIKKKIVKQQAHRIVLNLADSPVDLGTLTAQLHDWPIAGLKEIIVIDGQGNVRHFYP